MMNNLLPAMIIGVLVITAVIVLALVFVKTQKRGMSASSKAKVMNAWKHAMGIPDPVRKVIEADKVLDLALNELGFKGTVADKLKKAGPRFSDVNGVWRVHKLRNTLAHETGAHLSDGEAANAMRTFEKAINDLM
jgi:hypothetical protein